MIMQLYKIFNNLKSFDITYDDPRDGEELFKKINLGKLQRLTIDDGMRDFYGGGYEFETVALIGIKKFDETGQIVMDD